MVKAITIGYPSIKDKTTHKVLYSGDDRDAARAAAEGSAEKGCLLAEVIDPVRVIKRQVHDAPTAMVAPAPSGPEAAAAADDDNDDEQKKPARKKRR